ncbi:MAG TPA: metalloregulator ArsR/SmtB family transcription factor [Rhodospirillales bacterium]|jgi:DNA-binding transcriptional ArsR family regulator|nr:metalloregulator ArsR/SmtB family transcription factor [Rhodospirillales bacterium]
MEHDQVIELAEVFHLLGDPTRLRIVISCLDESQSVGYIADTLKVSSSLVSHHLRLLKGARLVRAERRGRNVFYVAADDHVRRTLSDMIDHVAESDGEEG